jgi:hypothetical protein
VEVEEALNVASVAGVQYNPDLDLNSVMAMLIVRYDFVTDNG